MRSGFCLTAMFPNFALHEHRVCQKTCTASRSGLHTDQLPGNMKSILDTQYYGNTAKDWIIALGIIFGVFIVVNIAAPIVLRRLKKLAAKTATHYDDIAIMAVQRFLIPFLYIGGVYLGLEYLKLPKQADKVVHVALLLTYTFFILRIITAVIQYLVTSFLSKQEDGETKQKQARGLLIILKFIIWAVGLVFTLDNLGFNVSTIIAGMGISGIAIALAAQAVLADLFSYFIIFFDRPFEIGDYIVFDTEMGVVEYIGVKSTKIRTLNGQILICSNKDLTNARVNNFKNIERRRTVFSIGVTYQTPADKLEAIPGMLKQIIDEHPKAVFDRAHFSGYGDSSLNFEVVYYSPDPDYTVFMDIRQEIFFTIFRKFEQEGLDFAYPTQTIFLENAGGTPPAA